MTIKVCGLTVAAEAIAIADAGAEFVGLIFADSPRAVDETAAAEIVARLAGHACQAVAVFRDQPIEHMRRILSNSGLRIVQLHGDESVQVARDLSDELGGLRVIRAVSLRSVADAASAAAWVGAAQRARVEVAAVLLDAPKGAQRPTLHQYVEAAGLLRSANVSVWCAGGLTPENVSEIIASGAFDGVDVAGGVERAPGMKDLERVAAFVHAVRATR